MFDIMEWSNRQQSKGKDTKKSITTAIKDLIEVIFPNPKHKMELITEICGGKVNMLI